MEDYKPSCAKFSLKGNRLFPPITPITHYSFCLIAHFATRIDQAQVRKTVFEEKSAIKMKEINVDNKPATILI